MSAALGRGIWRQKGDWAPGEEVTLATVHPLGHYFPCALSQAVDPVPRGRSISAAPFLGQLSSGGRRSDAAPHLKSPKRTGRAHEFFVGRARVSGHRELGEGAKGAAAARQFPASERSGLAGERASGPQDFSPSNPGPPEDPVSRATGKRLGECLASPGLADPAVSRHQETARHSGPAQ